MLLELTLAPVPEICFMKPGFVPNEAMLTPKRA